MMRFLFTRLVLPLLVFFLLRVVFKSVFASLRNPAPPQAGPGSGEAPRTKAGGELHKDPVCGTYVSEATAITRLADGHTLYFCSPQCRDKYKT